MQLIRWRVSVVNCLGPQPASGVEVCLRVREVAGGGDQGLLESC